MVSVCLNMIVRNEEKIITRCLDSVRDIVDFYLIVDTGSTDNTITIMKDYFEKNNLQAYIHQSTFYNFEHNRNEALKLCKGICDYILLLDADKVLKINNFNKDSLVKDCYNIIQKDVIYFYVSNETIDRSNFKKIKIGQVINLEKSLTYGQKISGHFTQGHVDTTARVKLIKLIDKSWSLKLEIQNKDCIKYLEEKASIAINGVSLTISKVSYKYFDLNIIPHTLKLTNLKNLKVNDVVNVEIDIFGKYIYKYTR